MTYNQFVVFRLGTEEYGVDILSVREIIRHRKAVKIPECPDFVEGIINYRDSVVPILNLNRRFKLDESKSKDSVRVIIVGLSDLKGQQIGFMVDRVEEVLSLREDSIEKPPDIVMENMDKKFVKAVGKVDERLIIILDIEKVLSETEKARLLEILE